MNITDFTITGEDGNVSLYVAGERYFTITPEGARELADALVKVADEEARN